MKMLRVLFVDDNREGADSSGLLVNDHGTMFALRVCGKR